MSAKPQAASWLLTGFLLTVAVAGFATAAPPGAEPDPEPDPHAVSVSTAMPVVTAAALRRGEDRRAVRDMFDSCGIASGTGLGSEHAAQSVSVDLCHR